MPFKYDKWPCAGGQVSETDLAFAHSADMHAQHIAHRLQSMCMINDARKSSYGNIPTAIIYYYLLLLLFSIEKFAFVPRLFRWQRAIRRIPVWFFIIIKFRYFCQLITSHPVNVAAIVAFASFRHTSDSSWWKILLICECRRQKWNGGQQPLRRPRTRIKNKSVYRMASNSANLQIKTSSLVDPSRLSRMPNAEMRIEHACAINV